MPLIQRIKNILTFPSKVQQALMGLRDLATLIEKNQATLDRIPYIQELIRTTLYFSMLKETNPDLLRSITPPLRLNTAEINRNLAPYFIDPCARSLASQYSMMIAGIGKDFPFTSEEDTIDRFEYAIRHSGEMPHIPLSQMIWEFAVRGLLHREQTIFRELIHKFVKMPDTYKAINNEPWYNTQRRRALSLSIASLLSEGEVDLAAESISKIKSDPLLLAMNPIVAFYASNNKILSIQIIKKSAYIYEHMKEVERDSLFKEYIQEKDVALVGSGPQELETGHGPEIDAHSIVARVQCWMQPKNCYNDYGARITACFCGPSLSNINISDVQFLKSLKFVFITEPLIMMFVDGSAVEKLATLISKQNISVSAISTDDYDYINDLVHPNVPSTGLRTVFFLKKYAGRFTINDVYGMSHKEDTLDSGFNNEQFHYYDVFSSQRAHRHDLQFEKQLFKKLFER